VDKKKKRGPKPGFWVKFHIHECVLCGYTEEFREHIYDRPKPKDPNERYEYHQEACWGHFL
jgi:hypothetical protein